MSITTYYQHIQVSGRFWRRAILRSGSTSGKAVKRRVIALPYLLFVLLKIHFPVDLPHAYSGHSPSSDNLRTCRKITFPNLRDCCTILGERSPCFAWEYLGAWFDADFPWASIHVLCEALFFGQGARRLYVGRRDHRDNTEQIPGSEPCHGRTRAAPLGRLRSAGHRVGSITAVAEATGLARPIRAGLAEVQRAHHMPRRMGPRRTGSVVVAEAACDERDRTLLRICNPYWRLPPVGTQSPLLWTSRAPVTLPCPGAPGAP
jgi:hypothetical protein